MRSKENVGNLKIKKTHFILTTWKKQHGCTPDYIIQSQLFYPWQSVKNKMVSHYIAISFKVVACAIHLVLTSSF